MWEQTHGERVSRWTMNRAIKRLGWTRSKKSLGATERNEEELAAWRENASKLLTEALVFLDECGSNIALTPCFCDCSLLQRKYQKLQREIVLRNSNHLLSCTTVPSPLLNQHLLVFLLH